MNVDMMIFGLTLAIFLILMSSLKIYRVDYISVLIKEADGSLCYQSIIHLSRDAKSWILMDEIKKVVGVTKESQIISMEITGYGYRMRRIKE